MPGSSKQVRIQLTDGKLLRIPPMHIESVTFPRIQIDNRFRKLVLDPRR